MVSKLLTVLAAARPPLAPQSRSSTLETDPAKSDSSAQPTSPSEHDSIFDLPLPRNGGMSVFNPLETNQSFDVPVLRVTRNHPFPMLDDPLDQVRAHPNVRGTRPVREDVDIEVA